MPNILHCHCLLCSAMLMYCLFSQHHWLTQHKDWLTKLVIFMTTSYKELSYTIELMIHNTNHYNTNLNQNHSPIVTLTHSTMLWPATTKHAHIILTSNTSTINKHKIKCTFLPWRLTVDTSLAGEDIWDGTNCSIAVKMAPLKRTGFKGMKHSFNTTCQTNTQDVVVALCWL